MPDSRVSRTARPVIFVLAVALLIYTIATTSVYLISPAELGLVSVLPITFWVGLVLLGGLWYFCLKGSSRYQAVALALTVCYVFVAPAIIKKPVWISESFYPFGESLLINSQGHLVVRDYAPLLSYQDWPIFLYLASCLKLVTGLPDFLIMKFFPLLTISMYGTLAFLILRLKVKSLFAALGAALFLSSYFLRQQYFGPQSIAYTFFLLIVLIMSRLLFDTKARKLTLAALFLLLFAVITLTHALTSLITLMVIISVYAAYRFMGRSPPAVTTGLVTFSASFLFAYNMFIAPSFFTLSVERTSGFLMEIWEAGILREGSRITGSSAQRMSYLTSWSIVFLIGLIAAIQLFRVLNRVRKRKQPENEEFSVFMVVWLILVGISALTIAYGSNEAYQRAFMFGLIPLTYLCVKLLHGRPKILLLVMCCLLFLNIPAQYGSDTYRLATGAVLAGTEFFVGATPDDVTCLYSFYPHVRYFDPEKYVAFVNIPGTLPFTSIPNATAVQTTLSKADYVLRSDLQHNYYVYFLREDPFEKVSFEGFNRVYDDQSFLVFVHPDSLP